MEHHKSDNGFIYDGEKIDIVAKDRIFVMPAAVGSTVYSYDPAEKPIVVVAQVVGYELKQDEWWVVVKDDTYYKMTMQARVGDLGKSWFLTEEDARAAASELDGSEALDRAYQDGIREGKLQFGTELKEYIYRNYGSEKGVVRATASHITDMIDALMYGYSGWGQIPREEDFQVVHTTERGEPDG